MDWRSFAAELINSVVVAIRASRLQPLVVRLQCSTASRRHPLHVGQIRFPSQPVLQNKVLRNLK